MTYNFEIQNETIQAPQDLVLYSGNVGTYHFEFQFHQDWDGFSRFAVFVRDSESYILPLTTNSIVIPQEILSAEGVVRFGLFATNGSDDIKRISSNMITIPIAGGAYRDGTKPQAPAPDLWETYFMQVQELVVATHDATEATKTYQEMAAGNAQTAKSSMHEAISAQANAANSAIIARSAADSVLGALDTIDERISGLESFVALPEDNMGEETIYQYLSAYYVTNRNFSSLADQCTNHATMMFGFDNSLGSVKTYIDKSIQTAIEDSWEVAV